MKKRYSVMEYNPNELRSSRRGGEPRRGRGLRRTSLYLDAVDRQQLAELAELLGLHPTGVFRLALRSLGRFYGLKRKGR